MPNKHYLLKDNRKNTRTRYVVCSKLTNKDTRTTVNDVVLLFLLLPFTIFTIFSSVSMAAFRQLNNCWVTAMTEIKWTLTVQVKHCECQFLFRASTYFSPPVIGFKHFPHFTLNKSSKHLPQYGLPLSTRKPSLPKPRPQNAQTKWSGCQLFPKALIQFWRKKI